MLIFSIDLYSVPTFAYFSRPGANIPQKPVFGLSGAYFTSKTGLLIVVKGRLWYKARAV